MRPYPPTPGGAAWGGCCHPADCQCDRCRGSTPPPPCPEPCACGSQPPHRPFPPKGFLLPRVLASDRVWLRRTCVTLNVRDLPTCAAPPLTLLSLRQGCQEPRWEMLPASNQRQLCLALTLPVDCQVRDANGCLYTGHTEISVDAALRLSFPACECWRNSLSVFPCIRLVQCAAASCNGCFEAEVEVLVELYMTRWEPCMAGVPKPVCPDLPLYPQPRIP